MEDTGYMTYAESHVNAAMKLDPSIPLKKIDKLSDDKDPSIY